MEQATTGRCVTTEDWQERVTRVRVAVVIVVVLGDNQSFLARVRVILLTLCTLIGIFFLTRLHFLTRTQSNAISHPWKPHYLHLSLAP